jgi:hypothetical protein
VESLFVIILVLFLKRVDLAALRREARALLV